MKRWFATPLLALLLPVSSAGACVLTAGWHGVNAPYVTISEEGRPGGLDIALLRSAARTSGCDIEFAPRPWRRLMWELKQGDVAIGVDVDSAAAEAADSFASDPYRDRRLRVWVRAADFAEAKGLTFEELLTSGSARVGLPVAYAARPALRALIEAAIEAQRAEVAGDVPGNLKRLTMGRIDRLFADEAEAEKALATLGLSDAVRKLPLAIDPTGATFALSRRAIDPELRVRLNDAIAALVAKGRDRASNAQK